ncbi:MAG: hypothetical protein HUJ62_01305 [Streptococcus gallolyticus]|nr:hypothetical protein [Streptococcus gallolyticus]
MYEAVVDYKCGEKENSIKNLKNSIKGDPLTMDYFMQLCPEVKEDKDFINNLIKQLN